MTTLDTLHDEAHRNGIHILRHNLPGTLKALFYESYWYCKKG